MDPELKVLEEKGLGEIREALKDGVRVYESLPDYGSNPRDAENKAFLEQLIVDADLCSKVFRVVRAIDQLIVRKKEIEYLQQTILMDNSIPVGKAN